MAFIIGACWVLGIWVAVAAIEIYLQVAERTMAMNALKAMDIALKRYSDEHGRLPELRTQNSVGDKTFTHSWRATLFDFEANRQGSSFDGLHYDFDQPWNSPRNQRVRTPPTDYRFLAVTGPGTIWEHPDEYDPREIADRADETILLIGVRAPNIDWFAPVDAVFDGEIITIDGLPLHETEEFFVLFASGHQSFFSVSPPKEIMAAIATANGGEEIPEL